MQTEPIGMCLVGQRQMLWRKSKQHSWGGDGGAWGVSVALPGVVSEGPTGLGDI